MGVVYARCSLHLHLWVVCVQSIIFDEVDLTDASVAESSTKNVNNSFTVRPRPLPVWVRPSTDAFRAESLTGSNGSQSVFALGYV